MTEAYLFLQKCGMTTCQSKISLPVIQKNSRIRSISLSVLRWFEASCRAGVWAQFQACLWSLQFTTRSWLSPSFESSGWFLGLAAAGPLGWRTLRGPILCTVGIHSTPSSPLHAGGSPHPTKLWHPQCVQTLPMSPGSKMPPSWLGIIKGLITDWNDTLLLFTVYFLPHLYKRHSQNLGFFVVSALNVWVWSLQVGINQVTR